MFARRKSSRGAAAPAASAAATVQSKAASTVIKLDRFILKAKPDCIRPSMIHACLTLHYFPAAECSQMKFTMGVESSSPCG